MTTANILSQLGSPGVSTGFKNRIINGAMVINQRGGTTTAASGVYGLDRWASFAVGGGVYTAEQSTTAPAGFANSAKFTVTTADSSIASSDIYGVYQIIEGFNIADLNEGTANAKSFTVSFWVQASVTGTYCVGIRSSAGDWSYATNYTISSANTWTKVSVTIPGTSGGSWVTNNTAGMYVWFDLGSGSNRNVTLNTWESSVGFKTSSQTPWISTNGATFYITGVQLEVGTTATNFDYRSYGTELTLCQRYFYPIINTATRLCIGFIPSSNNAYGITTLPVPMRVAPTISYSGSFYGVDASATGRGMTAGTDGTTPTIVTYYFTAGFNLNAGNATMLGLSSSGYVWASAEL